MGMTAEELAVEAAKTQTLTDTLARKLRRMSKGTLHKTKELDLLNQANSLDTATKALKKAHGHLVEASR